MDAKSQVVEKIKSANNILVTVSAETSVDQIAACIGLTLLLNKFKKNATAVFSGQVPAVLNFLKPKDRLERTTDSLRDFIIALDKSKADKLRYKIEDDVVKIFITPFRTSLSSKDLKYSAGEFNVDVILALGVHHQQDLDKAITAHGRIFHDAVVMSINNTPDGDLGVANWEDLEASSLSELVVELAEALDPSLLDSEVATALLTGIVAETSRFSNHKTHPRTLQISSKLLEAGADQHLVNEQLQDLIGTVIGLEAGAEIKPTKDTSQEPLHHDDVTEELVLNDGGQLKPSATAAGNQPDEPMEEADKSSDKPAELSPAEDDQPGDNLLSESAGGTEHVEDLLGAAVESTPAPIIESSHEDLDQADSERDPAAPSMPEPAEDARVAVEDALHVSAPTVPSPVSAEVSPPDGEPGHASLEELLKQADESVSSTPPVSSRAPSPVITPLASNQPSYANPATTTQYEMPVPPAHEPAPLVMSPADQAFTMPMPPSPKGFQTPNDLPPPPGGAASSPGVPPAPPLPPPIMPQ